MCVCVCVIPSATKHPCTFYMGNRMPRRTPEMYCASRAPVGFVWSELASESFSTQFGPCAETLQSFDAKYQLPESRR